MLSVRLVLTFIFFVFQRAGIFLVYHHTIEKSFLLQVQHAEIWRKGAVDYFDPLIIN